MSTTTLPPRVISAFRLVPDRASPDAYPGPWNKLLNTVFPPDSPYTVAPVKHSCNVPSAIKDHPPGEAKEDAASEAKKQQCLESMKFDVLYETLPVLLVLVSPPIFVDSPLARKVVDEEIRRNMNERIELCPFPNLRAISVFGHYMCMYTLEANPENGNRQIQPPLAIVEESPDEHADTAPRERWNADLLDKAGQEAFIDIINRIQEEFKQSEAEPS